MARALRTKRWRPVGAAVSFVLAAVAGVAGNQLTGHTTVALVVFLVLLVAGVAVTYLLERRSDSRARSDEEQGVGESGGPYDLRGAQGVQFGDHSHQVNHFGAERDPDRQR